MAGSVKKSQVVKQGEMEEPQIIGTSAWGAPPNPCFRAQMPNNDDPYSFYKCDAGGRPHLWRCSAGTMYDRRTEICDWEDQVRARNGQTSGGGRPSNGGNRGTLYTTRAGPMGGGYRGTTGGSRGGSSAAGGARGGGTVGGATRYGYGGGGSKDKDKIACYVANVDWNAVAKTAAYAYSKVKPILDSMHEDYHYGKYDKYDKYDKYSKDKQYSYGKGKGKGKDKHKYEESEEYEEEYDSYDLPPFGSGDSNGGRRPNRQPGPNDPDYDNGEDWGEYESWRDQFREQENIGGRNPSRDRDQGRDRDRDQGRDREPRRVDCSRPAPDGAPRMFQNPDDCSTYFTCNMRRPVLTYCPRGLNYNPRRQGCDDSDPPGCRVVRGSQTPNDVWIYQRRGVVPTTATTAATS